MTKESNETRLDGRPFEDEEGEKRLHGDVDQRATPPVRKASRAERSEAEHPVQPFGAETVRLHRSVDRKAVPPAGKTGESEAAEGERSVQPFGTEAVRLRGDVDRKAVPAVGRAGMSQHAAGERAIQPFGAEEHGEADHRAAPPAPKR